MINQSRKTKRNSKKNSKKTSKKQKGGNIFTVKYGDVRVNGQELLLKETQQTPNVNFNNTGKLYTLLMWDPDVPLEIQPGFIHWIVTNLQSPKNISTNEVLAYKGPSPPYGTHRYFFGLYEQNTPVSIKQPPRTNFDVNNFILNNKLKEVYKLFMIVKAV